MADQKTSSTDTILTTKAGLVTDLNTSHVGKDQYGYARNLVRNSKEGDIGTVSNESSTTLCFNVPYDIVGTVNLPDDQVLYFSGDGSSSEIGIGDTKTCLYTKVLNMDCLNFSTKFPITGVARKDFNKGTVVTFISRDNPMRRIDLSKIPKITSCDDTLLFKNIDHPCLTVNRGQVGNIPNGMYSVALAYVVDGQIFSDWYAITNRIPLYSDNNSNSLEIKLTGIDQEFEQFALVVIGNYVDPSTKGATKLAKIVGTYSTKVRTISITDFINSTYLEVPLSTLVIKKDAWKTAGIITSNSNYLLLADLVGQSEENYQLNAMKIETEYVITQVPANYYEVDGEDVGYYGDENYDYFIQGVYKSGGETDKFHIPGRLATVDDRTFISSPDVYEHDKDLPQCEEPGKIEKWRVVNTASPMIPTNDEFKCGKRVLGRGKMGYFESTDLYPDNKDMFGKWANTPVRYHKMPDECKVPRYSVIEGKTYINIKSVQFKNIPRFDNPDIIGYKITRSDRKGGNGTVIARGLMTNIRSYFDEVTNQTVMFSNYPVNDLSPDKYLSSKQTFFKNNIERDFIPLADYYKDRFNFYSPHTLFEPRYSLGTEIKIESEEVASITGKFEVVYNHPQQKLLNQFSFWLAASVGFIEATLTLLGKGSSKITTTSGEVFGQQNNTHSDVYSDIEYNLNSVEDLINFDIIGFLTGALTSVTGVRSAAGGLSKVTRIVKIIKAALAVIAKLAVKIPFSILNGIKEAGKVFDIIYNFTGYTDYAYQYNSHALFNQSICVLEGNKRRALINPALYIPADVVTIDDSTYNNLLREKSVYLHLNKPISLPKTKDNSRNNISGFGLCDNPLKQVTSTGSAFYVTSKAVNPNQYGRLGSSAPVSMHSCMLQFSDVEPSLVNPDPVTTSPILFGGDCIITRFQFQKRMQFFNQNLSTVNEGTNSGYPPGTEYDYKLYRNIGYPRYWMDTTKYDFAEIITGKPLSLSKFSRTTQSRHNLDCKKKNDGKSLTRIDDAYMYLSNNTVMDFFVECDYNINFRDKTDKPFYSNKNTNISQIFRSDRLETEEEFNINRVYSDIYTTEIFAQQQREDFDPLNPIPITQPNSVIYSLPSFNLQKVDNWQYFLPANYFAFSETDFGKLTAMHKIDEDRIIFLFSKASPFISMGRSLLKLSGQTVTIGDGGLFAQDPRELMPTDNNYAACNSRYAFSNTHTGRYYPSARQGRIINYTNNLDDISREGISYWCKNYMPIFLYKYFPSYEEIENPIGGAGYLTAFDSFNETVYLCKRDFSPKKEYVEDITYISGHFYYKDKLIELRDPNFFNDISWTLSYSPGDKGFISWHDWHPDWIIQTDNHFMSVKGKGVWKHNEDYNSFANYYGTDYPFEIEFISSSGQQIETLRSLEYQLEVYKFKNNGRNKFHVLNQNFDHLIVSNSEQVSPLLNLTLGNPNPEQNLQYPKINISNSVSYDVTYFKEENKYRVNQFFDVVKDRGEFTNNEVHLFATDESGYKSVINPLAIDINKPENQRKKFRHYTNRAKFIRSISGPHKFICKLLNFKKLISQK